MASGFQAVPFESAKVLRLQPGDIVVLRVRRELSDEELPDFTENVKRLFPDHKVVVLTGDDELQVFRKD
jgi:DNA-binding NarL/FixJ family response regulator